MSADNDTYAIPFVDTEDRGSLLEELVVLGPRPTHDNGRALAWDRAYCACLVRAAADGDATSLTNEFGISLGHELALRLVGWHHDAVDAHLHFQIAELERGLGLPVGDPVWLAARVEALREQMDATK